MSKSRYLKERQAATVPDRHELDLLMSTQFTAGLEEGVEDMKASNADQTKAGGWRHTMRLNIILLGLSLLINLICLITVSIRGRVGAASAESASIYQGSCNSSAQIALVGHGVINLLSTLMLSASNFTMQVLVAPTKEEVIAAHSRKKWMDIGIQSMKNIFYINKWRVTLWIMLGLTSIPLHLIYNAALYQSLATNQYFVSIVSSEFFDGGSFRVKDHFLVDDSGREELAPFLRDVQDASTTSETNNLVFASSPDCIDAYSKVFESALGNVVLIASSNANNFSNVDTAQSDLEDNSLMNLFKVSDTTDWSSYVSSPNSWICRDAVGFCDVEKVRAEASQPGKYWEVRDYNITGCWMEERSPNECQLNVNMFLLGLVILANVVKMAILTTVLLKFDGPTLVTLGDAVASFLEKPEPATRGLGLVGGIDFEPTRGHRFKDPWVPQSRRFEPEGDLNRWITTSSPWQWLGTGLILGGCLASMAYFFVVARHTAASSGIDTSIRGLWSLGFGSVVTQFLLQGGASMPASASAMGVIANTPQLALSLGHLLLNRLLTRMAASREWSRYAVQVQRARKGLRVTRPVSGSAQRSTYWLSLPYAFALPAMLFSFALHYLVSQALFFTDIQIWSAWRPAEPRFRVQALGYSPIAVFGVMLVAAAAIVALFLVGLVANPPGIPPAWSCSAAISAACHRPDGDVDAAEGLLRWGELAATAEEPVGHCCFTTEDVELPRAGRMYM